MKTGKQQSLERDEQMTGNGIFMGRIAERTWLLIIGADEGRINCNRATIVG